MEDDTDDRDDTKRRSRNLSEKKRRDQFNALVNDLSALISTSNRKMDKSTVLKSTITFLKHHNEATDRSKVFEIQQEWKPSFLSNDEFTQLMLESLDGFIIVFGSRGSIFYTSDSVTAQLGYLPCDLLKMTIFDLSYEMDHENLLNIFLNPKPVIAPMQTDIGARNQITFFLHLKRGGTEDCSRNSFELVKFVGYFRNDANVEVTGQNTQSPLPHVLQRSSASSLELDHKLIFVGTGRLQMPQMIREITVTDPTCSEFTSKHSMEWKFLFLDQRAPPIIGYMPFEVLGTSGYDYYHFDDLDDIVTCHEKLMQVGKAKSGYYRFLTKGHQWIWLQTDFFISYNQFSSKPEYVVCTHKVINYIDVLKYHKSERQKPNSASQNSTSVANNNNKPSTSTLTLRDLPTPNNSTVDTCITNTAVESIAEGVTAAAATAASTSSTVACSTPNNLIANNNSNSVYSHANLMGEILRNETSPSMDSSTLWTNPPTPTGAGQGCQLQPLKSNSRPASSYGNISSTGVSPNVKRKRYMYNCRGNESDSTSMSAESGTSRQSLMTHLSTSRQRLSSNLPHSNFSGVQHQHQQQQMNSSNQHHSHFQHQNHHNHNHHQQQQQQQHHHHHHQQQNLHPHTHQQQMQMNSNSQVQGQKIFQSLSQHTIVPSATMAGGTTCQFSQPTFPIRSPQIVAPPFIDSPQYLTAIPVQPVIAPFQVAPVISPLPVSFCTPPISNDIGLGSSNNTSSCLLKHHHQHDMLAGPVVMTSTQTQLQEQLQRKHDELQKLILQQQDELRIVSEQLLLARYTLLQPVMSMNYGQTEALSMGSNTRNFNLNNNALQQQFNQYGFAMNATEMNNQQIMLQHQQNLQQQLQHNQAQRHQCQQQQQQQHQQSTQHLQQQHTNLLGGNNGSSSNHPHPPGLHPEQHEQMLNLNRNVNADLEQFAQEEFDAFLNLSPLQNIGGSETTLNQIPDTGPNSIAPHTNSPAELANATTNPSGQGDVTQLMGASQYKSNSNHPAPTTSEDSLFSYIQMAAESSQTINFNMTLNDGITESAANNEDTKLISTNANPSNTTNPSNAIDHHQDQQHLPLPTANQTSATSQPTTPQRQVPQRSPLFSSSCQSPTNVQLPSSSAPQPPPAPGVNNNNNISNNNDEASTLSNVLNRMLPYQMGPEPLQNLFDTTNSNNSHTGGTNQ